MGGSSSEPWDYGNCSHTGSKKLTHYIIIFMFKVHSNRQIPIYSHNQSYSLYFIRYCVVKNLLIVPGYERKCCSLEVHTVNFIRVNELTS